MDYLKLSFTDQVSGDEVNRDLPEIIVEVYSSLFFFPETHPMWQIEVNPVHVGHGLFGQGTFNGLTIVRSGYNPNFVEARNLMDPHPADGGLRALSGFTGVR